MIFGSANNLSYSDTRNASIPRTLTASRRQSDIKCSYEHNARILIRKLILKVADNEFKMGTENPLAAKRCFAHKHRQIDIVRVLTLVGDYVRKDILSSFIAS